MRHGPLLPALPLLALLAGCGSPPTAPPPAPMSFFVTSAGPGRGGDLGGLDGADRHCQALADAAAAPGQPPLRWRAYLSQQSRLDDRAAEPSINARDRIGPGPWHNARGELIARTVDELHAPGFKGIDARTALTERGLPVPGRVHDILTGTRPDGLAPSPLDADMSCRNWRSSADTDARGPNGALVGHHDRVSAIAEAWAGSWNSAHRSRGCSPARLAELGSGGLFYCFATGPRLSASAARQRPG